METTADKVRAILYALLVHVLCIVCALGGLVWWQSSKPVSAAGDPIEAVFVDLGSLRPAAPPRPQPPRPQRQPPPPPPRPPNPPPTDQTAQDVLERQRIDRLAQLEAEEEAREQEEKRKRAEQLLLEEEQKRREEEERQQREREEAERREREEAEQQAREQAEKEAREQAEREAAEQAAQQQPTPGTGGEDDSLLARYGAAITRAVHAQWRVADNVANVVCTLRIIQIPGGEILDAAVATPCNADQSVRTSLERAARAAEPLPYQGFESVFRRELIITFCHPEGLPECTQ